MSYLAVFQHSGSKEVSKFPIALEALEEPPEVDMAFLINNVRDRLWEIKEVTEYKPIKLIPSLFESIYICGISSIELPRGFDYRDYTNIDTNNMLDIPFEEEKLSNTLWSVEYWKDGRIQANQTPLVLGAIF